MKLAAAMKYGGELIAAADCDYNSFKELVPLCPNCKEPVFLRVGGDRLSVKGKEYKVGPHWCHFKGISAEQVASCESRVNGYSEKDKQRIATQARGQRLKLLQRWFWNVLKQSPAFEAIEMQADDCVKYVLKKPESVNHLLGVLSKKVLAKKYDYARFIERSDYEAFKKNASDRWDTSAIPDYAKGLAYSDRTIGYMEDLIKCHLDTPSKFAMHKKMTKEAFLFFCSNSNEGVVKPIFLGFTGMFLAMWKQQNNSVLRITADDTDGIIKMVIQSLFTIPWASEFQRLEAEAKQQRGAA